MKICILSKEFPPHSTEGIARTRWIYARGLVRLGHEVHVITSGHDGYTYQQDGVNIHEMPAVRPDEVNAHFMGFSAGEHNNFLLSYSYRVYRKLQQLTQYHRFDLIDSPLWDIEGFITKLRMPSIPMIVRLETTSRQIREINKGDAGPFTVGDKFERNFLSLADGFVFDSWAIYDDVKRHYRYDFIGKPWRVVHHGIPEKPGCLTALASTDEDTVDSEPKPLEILYVGRLEKRKGADFLITKVIPGVLKRNPNFRFHIVGKDCSHVDGFQQEQQCNYSNWIEKHCGEISSDQVSFYGYLSDEEVESLYQRADLIANFSRYESFGLLYLEAMRMKKTQVVFKNAAISEILFGCENGPIQVQIDDETEAIESLLQLEEHRDELIERSEASYQHFLRYFTEDHMLKECEQFFEVFLKNQQPRIIHLMYALDQHDGVSNIALDYHELTSEMGFESILTGRHVHESLRDQLLPIEDCPIRDQDIVLIHYWGFCDFVPRYHQLSGKKVMLFHNITNPYFFAQDDPNWQGTAGAYAQMRELNFCSHVGTFSEFSQVPIRNYFGDSLDYRVLPPLMDSEEKRTLPFNETLLEKLKQNPLKKILFVGRVTSHKKQSELVDLLVKLDAEGQQDVALYLVGKINDSYAEEIMSAAEENGVKDRVILTGMVSEEDLYAYYRGCDVFVSMSEHEGFCLPLIDAMIFGLPVIAYAQEAVTETISFEKSMFYEKHTSNGVELVKRILSDQNFRNEVIASHQNRVKDFSRKSVCGALAKLIEDVSENSFQ